MLEDVRKRLSSFGYTVTETDEAILPFLISKVEKHIKAECNISEIPEGLCEKAVDMVCGELFATLRQNGRLDESFNVGDAIKTVQTGDTTVTFQEESDKLSQFISYLQTCGEGDYACYRTMRW